MKIKGRFIAVALGVTCTTFGAVAGGFIAQAQTAGKPEIDRTSAAISIQGPELTPTSCSGEDTITVNGVTEKTPYVTFTGSWSGTQTQGVPDPTDYPYGSAPVTLSNISWTINTNPNLTDRGVLTAKYVLGAASRGTFYSGKLVLITQGLPGSTAAPATGRGWIVANAKMPDDGVAGPNDDWLLANVEFPSLSLTGGPAFFGGPEAGTPAPAVPDYSVVTNTPPKATEVC